MRDLRPGRTIGLAVVAKVAAAGFALCALASPAAAQQVEAGPTTSLTSMYVRGVDTAADTSGNYLVLGGQGTLVGVCINAAGSPITGLMTINETGGYASFPRAVYSPHANNGAGAFLVVWAEAPGNPDAMRQLFARVVSCGAGLVGPARVVTTAVWWEPGNLGIAYSPSSGVAFVAWQTPEHTVGGSLIDNNGAPVGPIVGLSSGMGRDPSVTWNPATNQFGVSFSGETYSAFAVVNPANPAAFARNTFNVSGGILTTMTDVAYNPGTGRYIMSWFELSSGALARVAEFDANANLISQGTASTRLGSYDAFSMAFNPVSGTFVMVGANRDNDTVLGLELNTRGFPFNGENTLSAASKSHYSRIASKRTGKSFNVVFSGPGGGLPEFASLSSAIATSHASGGGPSGSFDAPPPSPPSSPTSPTVVSGGCTTIQPGPGWICENGGWRPPPDPTVATTTLTATLAPPPPTGCTTIQPGSDWVCVNGGWLPPTQPAPSTTTSAPPAPPPPPPSSTGCTTIRPGSDWVCVNGGWLPPGMAPAAPSAPAPAPAPTTSAGCVGVAPVAGWLCIQGNWIPPDHPLAFSGGGNEP